VKKVAKKKGKSSSKAKKKKTFGKIVVLSVVSSESGVAFAQGYTYALNCTVVQYTNAGC